MRLLIIRHGDPDYEADSLTEKGWREAELLADRMEKEKIDYFLCVPPGTGEGYRFLHAEAASPVCGGMPVAQGV